MSVTRFKKVANSLIFIILLILVMLPVVFVFYWMIATSLKTQIQNIAYPPLVFSFEPTLENYRRLLQETPYLTLVSGN